MIVTAVLAVVFLGSAALMWRQGAWSNILTFFNLVFAGLVASSFFEILATKVEEQGTSGLRYMTDFLGWWLIFAVTFNLMRLATDSISKHRVEFERAVEKITCGVMCAVNGWVLVCMVSMTLHLAPLNGLPFRDVDLQEPTFVGLSPDKMWLGIVELQSKSIMSGENEFSADGFTGKHRTRRAEFEQEEKYKVSPESSGEE
jgi:hypothetical protein